MYQIKATNIAKTLIEMDPSLIASIPSVENFIACARTPENITIEKINNTFMYYLRQNIGKYRFKIDINELTKGYKPSEVKILVLPLFAAYKAKGYRIKYKVYQKDWIYAGKKIIP